MQQYRFPRYTALAGVVTAMLVTVTVACGNNDDGAAPTQARKPLSGEEVFRGLVFGEGPIAAQFPEVWSHLPENKLTPEQQAAVERAKNQVVADLRQADPTFFDRFGADIQSGDHLRIEQAMDESAALVKQVARTKHAQAAPTVGERQGTCVYVDVVLTVQVAANFAEVVNFGEAYNVLNTSNFVYNENYFWDGSGESLWSGSQLGRDQMVDMMSQRLATN